MIKPTIELPSPKKRPVDPDMAKLFKALFQKDAMPNIITQDVFRQFEPLFRKNNHLSEETIKDLTNKYVRMVDFYKETQIIISSSNPTVIFTLPPLFVPYRSLDLTAKNSSLVAANQQMFHSEIPKYSTDAFTNMVKALVYGQVKNKSVIEDYKKRYISCVQDYYDKVSGKKPIIPVESETPIESDVTSVTALDQDTEWGYE